MPIQLLDPAPITRHLRAKASSHLMVVAIHHLYIFELLASSPLTMQQLQQQTGLAERPAMVLFPALCAMGLLCWNEEKLELTEMGRFLTTSFANNLTGYTALEKDDPGALKLKEWLLNDGPEHAEGGFSYVKDDEAPSPMDEPQMASFFTMALAGRARYLAPIVAQKITQSQGHLLDVAGGSGYYTFEWLLANPQATATLLDRPEVLKVAQQLLESFCSEKGVQLEVIQNRITFLPGDMLTDALPQADILLAASLFHDWPTSTCRTLATTFAKAIKPGGNIWIHDAFLNDTLDGPLAVTDYSAMLFLGTKGRAYSKKEYRSWLAEAGLQPTENYVPTLMDYGLISAKKM